MINNTTPNKLLTLTINEKIDKICDESHTFLTLIKTFINYHNKLFFNYFVNKIKDG